MKGQKSKESTQDYLQKQLDMIMEQRNLKKNSISNSCFLNAKYEDKE